MKHRAPLVRTRKETIAAAPGRERELAVRTAIGPVIVVWRMRGSAPRVVRIRLPRESSRRSRGAAGTADGAAPRAIAELASRITAFCAGRAAAFDLSLLELDGCPLFQRAVLLAESGIPRGSVSTYGRIAARIGHPRAARAVGTALARNPFPIAIPCHRAVRADGTLGGFRGGLAMKRRLLELEGVAITPSGRVAASRFHYDAAAGRAARRSSNSRKERR